MRERDQLRRLPRADGRRGRVRLRRLVRRRGVRGADQGRDEGDDSRAARRGVPLGRGADDLSQVRHARRPPRRYGRRRTDRPASPASTARSHCEGVSARAHRARGRHAGVRLQRGDDSRSLRAARRGARAACRTAFTTRSRRTRTAACCALLRELGAGVGRRVGRRAVSRARAPASRRRRHHLRRRRQDGARARARRSRPACCCINVESEAEVRAASTGSRGERGVVAPRRLARESRGHASTRRTTTSRPASKGHKFGIPFDEVRRTSRDVAASLPNVALRRARHAHRLAALAHRSVSRRHRAAASICSRELRERGIDTLRVSRHRRRTRRVATTTEQPPDLDALRASRCCRRVAPTGLTLHHGAGTLHRRQRRRAARRACCTASTAAARITSSPTPA